MILMCKILHPKVKFSAILENSVSPSSPSMFSHLLTTWNSDLLCSSDISNSFHLHILCLSSLFLHFPIAIASLPATFFSNVTHLEIAFLTIFSSFLKIFLFIYLAVLSLGCSLQDLLVEASELLLAVCGIYFLNQGLNPVPCIGLADHQGSPFTTIS